jgi:glycosyltransferase involved in cell wall biosynthesis
MSRRLDFTAELILVCNSLDAGGIERVVSTLANEWSRRGRKVSVITLHDRRRLYKLDPAVHHVIVDRVGLSRIADLLRWFATRLRAEGQTRLWLLSVLFGGLVKISYEPLFRTYFDIACNYEAVLLRRALRRVESPLIVSLGMPVNIITLKASKGLKRRVVISERSDPTRPLRVKNWNALARKLYQNADLVTANTHGALRNLSDFVEDGKLAFVPNPLALSNGNGHASHTESSPQFLILSVARLVWDKAQDVLLNAFAQLGDEFDEWRLAIIGDGRLSGDLRAQARRLGIAGRVDWHGIVDDPHAFYRTARIFALPSRVEGMPNALLEAMSCGLPVVVSDGAPGPLELGEAGVTGLVVPVNDAVALAAALRRLAADESLRKRLGEAARERVSEYDLPHALAAWEAVVGLARLEQEARPSV